MEAIRAKNQMNAEDARKCVQTLLEDPAFQGLHGRLGGTELYRSFVAIAEQRQNNPQTAIGEQAYSSRISAAGVLLDYESNQKRLEHSTDGEPVTCKAEDGSLDVLVGGGAAAGGYTIHINPTRENSVTYGNGH